MSRRCVICFGSVPEHPGAGRPRVVCRDAACRAEHRRRVQARRRVVARFGRSLAGLRRWARSLIGGTSVPPADMVCGCGRDYMTLPLEAPGEHRCPRPVRS